MRIGRFRLGREKGEKRRGEGRRLRCNCKTDGKNGGGGGAAAILNELAARGNGTNKKTRPKVFVSGRSWFIRFVKGVKGEIVL